MGSPLHLCSPSPPLPLASVQGTLAPFWPMKDGPHFCGLMHLLTINRTHISRETAFICVCGGCEESSPVFPHCCLSHLQGRSSQALPWPAARRTVSGAYLPPPWVRADPRRPPGRRGRGHPAPGRARAPAAARTPPAAGPGPRAAAASPRWLGSCSCVALWFCSGRSCPVGPRGRSAQPAPPSEGLLRPPLALCPAWQGDGATVHLEWQELLTGENQEAPFRILTGQLYRQTGRGVSNVLHFTQRSTD